MNEWTWILITVLVALHLLDLLADYLNLRSLDPDLPAEFADIYDAAEYKRLQLYTAATTRVDAIASTLKLAALIAFWVMGGFGAFAQWVAAYDLGILWSGLIYIGALYLAATLLALPFSIYDTFVIEQRFGFNKTNTLTFITDQLKGLVLAAILGGSLLMLLIWLLLSAGPHAWLYAWAVVTLFMVGIMYLAPAVIMPLFNKFSPLDDGELKQAILAYAEKENFPLAGVYTMDGSRRSSRVNAFFTGFGHTKKIVLFDTLIENHDIRELVAILAHEIGHYKLHHIVRHMVLAVLNAGIFLLLASRAINSPTVFQAFGVELADMNIYVGLAIFSVLYSPLSQVMSVALSAISRKHEYEADAFAARTTGSANPLVEALKKLSRSNLTNLAPHRLQVILHHSHPPVLERIAALTNNPIKAD